MKADLYVQGHFWASIDVPGDGLLSLLANGMVVQAKAKAMQLKQDLNAINDISCTISLRFKQPVTYTPDTSP